jgi:SAM-dependent methyltransferase
LRTQRDRPAATGAQRTYDAFAPFYDRFTAGYDHAAWTATLEELAAGAGLRGRRLLDVACGTGMSFLPMLDRGYEVTACDLSPEMAARAAAKAGGRARVEVCDMRRLPRYGRFDLVWCLDDSLNYLLGTDDLVAALSGMRDNLDDDGVLIFDVNSIRSYRSFFASLAVVPSDDCVLTWDGEATEDFAEGGMACASMQALRRLDDGTWERTEIVHRQRHHPERRVRSALERAGLRCEGVWGMQLDGSTLPGFDELRNSKAVFVCTRRPARA